MEEFRGGSPGLEKKNCCQWLDVGYDGGRQGLGLAWLEAGGGGGGFRMEAAGAGGWRWIWDMEGGGWRLEAGGWLEDEPGEERG